MEFDPTNKQSLPTLCSKDIGDRLYKRLHDPRSRTLLPVWDGVGHLLSSVMGQYEQTHGIDARGESHAQ